MKNYTTPQDPTQFGVVKGVNLTLSLIKNANFHFRFVAIFTVSGDFITLFSCIFWNKKRYEISMIKYSFNVMNMQE